MLVQCQLKCIGSIKKQAKNLPPPPPPGSFVVATILSSASSYAASPKMQLATRRPPQVAQRVGRRPPQVAQRVGRRPPQVAQRVGRRPPQAPFTIPSCEVEVLTYLHLPMFRCPGLPGFP